MSALGVVPGYGYPQLDYASAEFSQVTQPTFTLAAPGSPFVPIVGAGDGYAYYIRDIGAVWVLSAVAGVRTLNVLFRDGDNNTISQWRNPIVPAPSTQNIVSWSIGTANAYTIQNAGYSPLPGIVMPPGFSLVFQMTQGQAGDNLQFISATGLRIGTATVFADTTPAVRPLALT